MNTLVTNLNVLSFMDSAASLTEIGTLVVAGSGGVATFVASYQALRDHGDFDAPGILALCAAVLAFYGLLSAGIMLLIPFTVLGVVCLMLPVIALVSRHWNWPLRRRHPERNQSRLPGPTVQNIPEPNTGRADAEPSRIARPRPARPRMVNLPEPIHPRVHPELTTIARPRPANPIIPLEIKHPAKGSTVTERRSRKA